MLSSLPCFPAFCWSDIPIHLITFLLLFSLVYVTSLAAGAWNWSLPSITEKQKVCLHWLLRRASALLSVKRCCFVWKLVWMSHAIWTSPTEEQGERKNNTWPFGDILVQYFHDAFSCHYEPWKYSVIERLISLPILSFWEIFLCYRNILRVCTIPT